jgi:hypothetical protein
VLASGATLSDTLVVVAYGAFNVANTYTIAQADAAFIPDAIVDAKGDLIAATAADTVARLAIGNNGETLVADSTTATGLKYGRPTSLGCYLYKTNQTIATAAQTAITFEYEVFDTSSFHDNSTNISRITIPAGLGGKYLFNCQWAFGASAIGQRVGYLVKNGSGIDNLQVEGGYASFQSNVGYSVVLSLSAGDYVEMHAYQDTGGNLSVLGTAQFYTSFQAIYLGA